MFEAASTSKIRHDETAVIYSRLMLHAGGLPNDERLAKMLASQATGIGALPPGLGLSAEAFAAMLIRHFPRAGPIGMGGPVADGDGRFPERRDLIDLLIEHRAGLDASEAWMAEIVAAACMGGDHLWQDLGLWSRRDLGGLMTENFPHLADQNVHDMKWKKFLYRRICEREGVHVCPAPSCQACVDHSKCFNTEQ